ncbi:type I restriction enzyme, S subunit [Marinobacter persicus]|uniref:Type I restriction enzyme, S subunit n=1 Tax=Marinobacter persicus TaxID=930118 RepID=A0A1I3V1L6_9GAMM|nr:restriction endonuclease subunit S [Marinobacter persicus]GHD41815.1 type I restriction modification enzyme protein S [Marinobacter persicus]SFJ89125.1 type I restriction enzyme, S subunit [Marinobacter persicus]
MSEWIESPLEKLADISSGGTPARANPSFWNGHIPWVTPTDITACQTNYLFDTRDTVTEIGISSSSAKLLPEGTLLLTSRATIGELKIAARPLTTNQGFKNLVPRPLVDGNFLFYQLSLNKAKFERYAAGSTFLEINRRDVGRVAISLPRSVEVQQKIARILGTIDQAIEKTQVLIDKYQQIKAGLMHDLFTRGIGSDGQLRPCREQSPELYQETPIGWLPNDWETLKLSEILQKSGGYLQTGPFGSQLHSHEYTDEGIPVVMPQDINNGSVDDSHIARITESRAQTLAKHRLKIGDIIIARRGELSRAAAISQTEEGWVCGTGCFLLRLGGSSLDSRFFSLAYRHSMIQRQVDGLAVGSTMPSLNNGIVSKLVFPYMRKEEQSAIADKVQLLDNRKTCAEIELKKLKRLKFGLMHDLLTGEVPVRVESEEERAVETV